MGYGLGPIGTGGITLVSGSASIIGVGTAFLTQLQAGDVLFFAESGVFYSRTVASVTNNTTAAFTANSPVSVTEAVFYIVRSVEAVFGMFEIRSTPEQEFAQTYSGTFKPVGYPRSIWEIGGAPIATWYNARAFVLGSGAPIYSGPCVVTTRRDIVAGGEDVFKTYTAISRWTLPGDYGRWGGINGANNPLKIEFILIAELE